MQLNSSSLKIAIQKQGRLMPDSLTLLKKIGLEFESFENKLIARVRNFDLDILFLRDDDIPEYVADQVCDLGIVGQNVIKEKTANVICLQELGFGLCQLAIAAPTKSSIKKINDLQGKRIATSYPQSLKNFLKKNRLTADIIKIRGSVEITPALNVSDAICDLVSTGTTLRLNGLKIFKTIFRSQAVLIGNKQKKSAEKQQLINQLILRIQSALQGQVNRYILMNAPQKRVPDLIKMLPSLKSPTLMPLARTGLVALHTVVPAAEVWQVIEQAKTYGASGLLVLPIENMIL